MKVLYYETPTTGGSVQRSKRSFCIDAIQQIGEIVNKDLEFQIRKLELKHVTDSIKS